MLANLSKVEQVENGDKTPSVQGTAETLNNRWFLLSVGAKHRRDIE